MKLINSFLLISVSASLMACSSLNKGWKQEKVVVMPECSVSITRQTEGTGYSNQFRNRGLSSTMVVYTPMENPKVYHNIADESCGRLKAKLNKLGYTVLAGAELEKKSEKYKEMQKDLFTKEPDLRDQYAYFPSSETGVPKGGMGFSVGMGYAKINNAVAGVMIYPTFQVGFGEVKGGGSSVTDSNSLTTSTTTTKYSPMVTVKRDGSKIPFNYAGASGALELKKDINDNSIAWLNDIVKGETKTNAISAVNNLMFGGRKEQATYYTMSVDESRMKEAILAQLEKAEDEFVSQIATLKTE